MTLPESNQLGGEPVHCFGILVEVPLHVAEMVIMPIEVVVPLVCAVALVSCRVENGSRLKHLLDWWSQAAQNCQENNLAHQS